MTVEIAGMSVVTPIAIGVEAFSEALKRGHSNFSVHEASLEDQSFQFPIGKVEDFDLKTMVKELPLPEEIIKKSEKSSKRITWCCIWCLFRLRCMGECSITRK